MSNNQELIWVDKAFAKAYNELGSDNDKALLVNKLIKQKGLDITSDIENLDDDLLRFKAFALNYSTAFKKTYQEQMDSIEKFYTEMGYVSDEVESKIRKVKDEVSKIGSEINKLNIALDNVSTYKFERLADLITKFNSMSSEDKRIFELILKLES